MSDPFTVDIDGTTLKLGVHADNVIGEPRVQWATEDGTTAGRWALPKVPPNRSRTHTTPFETLDVAEPQLVFGRDGSATPTIADIPREHIILPDDASEQLRAALEALGTIDIDAPHVETDPEQFPSVIEDARKYLGAAEWDQQEWDAEYNLMWYVHRGHDETPRAYQFVDDTLVWRKHSWKTITRSKRELMNAFESGETA